jgi:hypothetical protein
VVLYTSRQDPKHSTFFCLFTKIKLKVKGKWFSKICCRYLMAF